MKDFYNSSTIQGAIAAQKVTNWGTTGVAAGTIALQGLGLQTMEAEAIANIAHGIIDGKNVGTVLLNEAVRFGIPFLASQLAKKQKDKTCVGRVQAVEKLEGVPEKYVASNH